MYLVHIKSDFKTDKVELWEIGCVLQFFVLEKQFAGIANYFGCFN